MTSPPSAPRGSGPPATGTSSGRHALLVGAGILLSRLAGLVRQRVFSHYFGLRNDAADAFTAAFRIPNFLQNLFGEGALSASFIPVYAALLARGERREADRVAGAVAALLTLIVAAIVLLGVVATPLLIAAVAPGFHGSKRELTIAIVRILFPGAGLFVVSAWCLGVLNSHHRFLLSYASGVMWNAAMIATLVIFGAGTALPRLAVILAWGSVAGSALQFAVQVPVVWRVAPDLRLSFDTTSEHVRTIGRNFVPALLGRGVNQVSAYVDQLIASLLGTGAVTGLQNASTLYTLPMSLFGMAVSAAELPAMSGLAGADAASIEVVRRRLDAGLRRIAFFVVPSAVAFLALGDVVVGALFQTGRFDHRRLDLRLADPRRIGRRPARVDARPALFVHLLRVSRHADAAALRRHPGRAHDGDGLSLRDPPAAAARRRAGVGSGGADRVGRDRRLGRDAAAARDAQRADRRTGLPRHTSRSLGIRDRRGAGVGVKTRCRRCIRSPCYRRLASMA